MGTSDRLKTAGEAAELLEQMGYVSVARMRDGIVTLECWERTGGRVLRHVIEDDNLTHQASWPKPAPRPCAAARAWISASSARQKSGHSRPDFCAALRRRFARGRPYRLSMGLRPIPRARCAVAPMLSALRAVGTAHTTIG